MNRRVVSVLSLVAIASLVPLIAGCEEPKQEIRVERHVEVREHHHVPGPPVVVEPPPPPPGVGTVERRVEVIDPGDGRPPEVKIETKVEKEVQIGEPVEVIE